MVEKCTCMSRENSFSVTVTLKSLFYGVVLSIKSVLEYVLSLEGEKSRSSQISNGPKSLGEIISRARWHIVNYLKQTRICSAFVHMTSAVKCGECSHSVSKQEIQLEIKKLCESKRKTTWLCLDYVKSLACAAVLYFARTFQFLYDNPEPEKTEAIDAASLHAHKIMDQMWSRNKESIGTTGGKISGEAEVSSSTSEKIVSIPRLSLSVRKTKHTVKTHETPSSAHNNDSGISSGIGGLQLSASLGGTLNSQSSSITSRTEKVE